MEIYIAICLSLLFPLYLQQRTKQLGVRMDRTPLALACLILCELFALRACTVGVDTKFYCHAFTQFRSIALHDLFREKIYATAASTWSLALEPGYRLLNKLLSSFTTAPQAITIANALLLFVFLYCFIRDSSNEPMLSIWLFVTLGLFQSDMNITRNAIAVFLCFSAFRWIRERRLLRYVLTVLLASTIHQTALLFLPLYFLVRYVQMNPRRVLILLLVFLALGLNISLVRGKLAAVFPARYARYFASGSEKLVTYLVGLFHVVITVFAFTFLNRTEYFQLAKSWKYNEGLWMLALNIGLFAMSFGFSAASRAAALFSPYMIVFIPNILDTIETERRKQIGCMAVAVLSFVQYISRMMINNIGGSMPYQFFWQG